MMDNGLLLGCAGVALLGVGFLIGLLMGQSRRRLLQRELVQVRFALQQSQDEVQQREAAIRRNQQELQRLREEIHQYQEEIQRSQQDFLRSQEETRQYRTQVTQHFTQTAELLQALTLNYRAVYEHLAVGAEALCDGQVKTLTSEALRERLLAPPNEEPVAEGVAAPQPGTAVPEAEQHPVSSSQDPSYE